MNDLLSHGEDVTAFGRHLTVFADKAETRFYRCDSLVAYDKAIRTAAAKEGSSKFGSVDSNLVMLHLAFGGSSTIIVSPSLALQGKAKKMGTASSSTMEQLVTVRNARSVTSVATVGIHPTPSPFARRRRRLRR